MVDQWLDLAQKNAWLACFVLLIGAIVVVARWVVPRVDKLITAHIALLDGLVKSMANGETNNKQTVESLSVIGRSLGGVLTELMRNSQRDLLLVIEDSRMEQLAIKRTLGKIADEYDLKIVLTSRLSEAVQFVSRAELVILDVILPDSTGENTAAIFSAMCPCPVIIYTGIENPNMIMLANITTVDKKSGVNELATQVTNILTAVHNSRNETT